MQRTQDNRTFQDHLIESAMTQVNVKDSAAYAIALRLGRRGLSAAIQEQRRQCVITPRDEAIAAIEIVQSGIDFSMFPRFVEDWSPRLCQLHDSRIGRQLARYGWPAYGGMYAADSEAFRSYAHPIGGCDVA